MSKKIAVLLANGFEEVEGLAVVDVLRRAGFVCDMVGVEGEVVQGSHGIRIFADKLLQGFHMGRSAFSVNVNTVGRIMDD